MKKEVNKNLGFTWSRGWDKEKGGDIIHPFSGQPGRGGEEGSINQAFLPTCEHGIVITSPTSV